MTKPNHREWRTPKEVCNLYRVPYSQRLSMQLIKFGKHRFPKKMGIAGRKIKQLRITKKLHQYLERLNQRQ